MVSRFRKTVRQAIDGWQGHKKVEQEQDERFVMKPGEVRVIKGGGARVDRRPDQKRKETR